MDTKKTIADVKEISIDYFDRNKIRTHRITIMFRNGERKISLYSTQEKAMKMFNKHSARFYQYLRMKDASQKRPM